MGQKRLSRTARPNVGHFEDGSCSPSWTVPCDTLFHAHLPRARPLSSSADTSLESGFLSVRFRHPYGEGFRPFYDSGRV